MDKFRKAMRLPIVFSLIVLISFTHFSYAIKFKPDFHHFRNIKGRNNETKNVIVLLWPTEKCD